jgi:hypothetical protein
MKPAKPIRLRLSRKAGFNLQALSESINGLPAVNCARPGPFGNPIKVSAEITPTHAVAAFRAACSRNPDFVAKIKRDLRGKNLACWCRPGIPCHCDVLLDLANS